MRASSSFDPIYHKALAGETPDHEQAMALADAARDEPGRLIEAAAKVRDAHRGRRVQICAIVNAKSGRCSEDCAFCAQSAHHRTAAPEHPFIGAKATAQAAFRAREAGVSRFGIVTSGLRPTRAEFEELVEAVGMVRDMGLEPDVSVGLLDAGQLDRLRQAGLRRLHHNLETSAAFFPNVCTTHAYEDDVAVVRAALAMGVEVCSGGLFGLGESWRDRAELALTLAGLGVSSVPMNFLNPIPGTRLGGRAVITAQEAAAVIALFRLILPLACLRICGGREAVFGPDPALPLAAGADGLMVGDYLTTPGQRPAEALAALRRLGYQPV